MTSFMTSLEARNHQNINQVRMFTSNNFSQPEGSEKWDRVKIVCIQQYNKHVQYGLSFVTMHCNEGSGLAGKRNVNKFTLRADSPTSFSVGTLFSKERENLKLDVIPSTSLKGAAAIREASTKPSHSPHRFPIVKRPPTASPQPSTSKDDSNDSEESKDKNRNRKNLLYDDEDEAPNDKIDRLIEIKQKEDAEKQKLKEKADSKKATPNKTPKNTNGKTGNSNQVRKRKTDTQPSVLDPDSSKSPKNRRTVDVLKDVNTTPPNAGPSSPTTSKQKRRSSEIDESNESPRKKMKGANGEERKHQTKRYENLLEGVVFVISGIQNPERAQLRTSAMALGAKYKADWDRTCTHLICAFANTPKFNQVRGKGKIVKKQWIIECEKQRKRLPWRRFCLDRRDNTGNESEDEIWEEVELSDRTRIYCRSGY
ncbi:DNA repair protein XRCC1-like isoform X1 [Atheta coriaria]|uniref:DNA repair protein XRCC1-like isoform X1 n=2 Tax=Dalotia coriaria TaxID=877792 RepID=UPI0031F38FD1